MRRAAGEPERRFADALRDERIQHGWTQKAVANTMVKLGFPSFMQTTIAKIEAGHRPISLNEAMAFTVIFGKSILADVLGLEPNAGVAQDAESIQNIEKLQETERMVVAHLQEMEREHRQRVRNYLKDRLADLGPEEE